MRFDGTKTDTLNLRVAPSFKKTLKLVADAENRSMINMLNAEQIVMQSPLFRSPDFALFPGLFSPHNGASFERGDQLVRCLKATRA